MKEYERNHRGHRGKDKFELRNFKARHGAELRSAATQHGMAEQALQLHILGVMDIVAAERSSA